MIQEIQAVLVNLPDSEPTGWEPGYGPGAVADELAYPLSRAAVA